MFRIGTILQIAASNVPARIRPSTSWDNPHSRLVGVLITDFLEQTAYNEGFRRELTGHVRQA